MAAGARLAGAILSSLLGLLAAACAPAAPTTSSGGGFNGTYACSGTTTTPAGSSYGTGTFQCTGGQCADESGAFSGTVDGNGDFRGTDVLCQTCVPLPMSGHMSTTAPFTISGSSGGVSATFTCQCAGACGGGSGGGGPPPPPPPAISYVSPTIVVPGNQVQIVGDDFPLSTDGLSVKICGIDVEIVATGLHAIIAVMPPVSPGTCDVVVTAPGGSSTLPGAFTILEPFETIAGGTPNPTALALDATHAYWLEDTALKRVPKAGGTVEVLATGLSFPEDLAVDGASVYWTEQGKVRKVPKGGGTAVDLFTGVTAGGGIAVDSTRVYWAYQAVYATGLDGGTPEVLAPFDDWSDAAHDVVLDGATVYFITWDRVRAVPAAGGTPSTLYASADGAHFLALYAGTAYWTEYSTTSFLVRSLPLGGEAATTLYSRGWNLAVDPTGVYVTVKDGGRLMRISHDGSTAATIAQPLIGPWGVATDDTHVYWTDGGVSGEGAVRRLAK